jgi:AcrR family transcriptional regulator
MSRKAPWTLVAPIRPSTKPATPSVPILANLRVSEIFVDDGVLEARLEDIRREAGASVGALYHHFPSKEALHAETWFAALGDYQRGFLETLERSATAEQGVRGVVAYQLHWVRQNRQKATLLFDARPTGAQTIERVRAQNRDFFRRVLAWWRVHVGYDAVRGDLEVELLHALWLGSADSYYRHWLSGETRKSPTAAATELADAAWACLKGAAAS